MLKSLIWQKQLQKKKNSSKNNTAGNDKISQETDWPQESWDTILIWNQTFLFSQCNDSYRF